MGDYSARKLIQGQSFCYKKECNAAVGEYVETSNDDVIKNDNLHIIDSCITLGTAGNRQKQREQQLVEPDLISEIPGIRLEINYEEVIGPHPSGVESEQKYAASVEAVRARAGMDDEVETRDAPT